MLKKLLLVSSLSACLFADEPIFTLKDGFNAKYANDKSWHTTDTVLQTLVLTGLYIDWRQARAMEGYGWDKPVPGTTHTYYREGNMLLAGTPSRGAINRYNIAVGLLSTYAATKMSIGPRRLMQCSIILLQAAVISHNVQVGFKVTF